MQRMKMARWQDDHLSEDTATLPCCHLEAVSRSHTGACRCHAGACEEHASRSNSDTSPGSKESIPISNISKRPRRLRAKYTHGTNLTIYALCISPCGAVPPEAGGTKTAEDLWITGAGPWKSARTASCPSHFSTALRQVRLPTSSSAAAAIIPIPLMIAIKMKAESEKNEQTRRDL